MSGSSTSSSLHSDLVRLRPRGCERGRRGEASDTGRRGVAGAGAGVGAAENFGGRGRGEGDGECGWEWEREGKGDLDLDLELEQEGCEAGVSNTFGVGVGGEVSGDGRAESLAWRWST
jgi:hypothetical protein